MTEKKQDIPDAIDEIYDRLDTLFDSDAKRIKGWLHTPNVSLPGGMTPNEMLKAKQVVPLLTYVRGMSEVAMPVSCCSS